MNTFLYKINTFLGKEGGKGGKGRENTLYKMSTFLYKINTFLGKEGGERRKGKGEYTL